MNTVKTAEVEQFIRDRFPADCKWLTGNCYYFAAILKARFPEGEICYDVIEGHFMLRIDGCFYDYRGLVVPDGKPDSIVAWDSFNEYDSVQRERIMRDCIL